MKWMPLCSQRKVHVQEVCAFDDKEGPKDLKLQVTQKEWRTSLLHLDIVLHIAHRLASSLRMLKSLQ